jgi:hypothetical protein
MTSPFRADRRSAPRLAGLALVAALSGACQGGPAPAPPPPPTPIEELPWTEEFSLEAVLLAKKIRVVGPLGLRDHVALRQEPELFQYTVKTVPDGLLQRLVPLPGVSGREMQLNLDAWTLVAFEEIEILERPGDAPVVLRAEGDVSWHTPDGHDVRKNVLEVVGERPR